MQYSASPIVRSLTTAAASYAARRAEASRSTPEPLLVAHNPAEPRLLQGSSPLPPASASNTGRKRSLQHVLCSAERVSIVKWMVVAAEADGDKYIASRAVRQFPSLFRGNEKANNAKASRLWKCREEILKDQRNKDHNGITLSLTRVTRAGLKRVYVKARVGRGRKRAAWVTRLHSDLMAEFERLRKSRMKFKARLLRHLAQHLVSVSSNAFYHNNIRDPKSGKLISDLITPRWVQAFMNRFQIVSRAQTGKLMLAPEKQEWIEREVAFHLGVLAREFRSGALYENDVGNADETHFLINMDNHRTLGRCGEEKVKYSDVVSGSEGMKMMVRISGGRDAIIEPPFLIFQNANRSYPIQRVSDDVPGVSYRSRPKGWMDRTILPQYLLERKVMKPLSHGRKRVLYVDNCSGHAVTPETEQALAAVNTELRFFPANATDLLQPADSFIIQKLNDAWRARCDKHKLEIIQRSGFSNSSGKIPNPGKHFVLTFAASTVRDVNAMRDSDGLRYARKAMIRTGLALNTNGQWEERQLFPKLQVIIRKYRSHFDGAPVVEAAPIIPVVGGSPAVEESDA